MSIGPLLERIAAPGAPADVSLLLTGPPGTGKTALAAALAERLDRPLLVKRASDLLSKWVGETEARIADAFAEARESGALLLFDEADSLLSDRADARRSWEISQVNELLTWMDFPSFALRRGDELRQAARSGGAPALRLQDRADRFVAAAGGAGLGAVLRRPGAGRAGADRRGLRPATSPWSRGSCATATAPPRPISSACSRRRRGRSRSRPCRSASRRRAPVLSGIPQYPEGRGRGRGTAARSP